MSLIKSKLQSGRISDITKMNVYSKSFDFLKKELNLYSIQDIW